MWSLAAPSLLAVKEAAECIADLAEASERIRVAIQGGTLPTDTEILDDFHEPDEDLIEPEHPKNGGG